MFPGWASVKYRGRKMDHFKNLWLKMKSKRESTTGQQNASGNASYQDNDHDNDNDPHDDDADEESW
jgi:hypothetical protein